VIVTCREIIRGRTRQAKERETARVLPSGGDGRTAGGEGGGRTGAEGNVGASSGGGGRAASTAEFTLATESVT